MWICTSDTHLNVFWCLQIDYVYWLFFLPLLKCSCQLHKKDYNISKMPQIRRSCFKVTVWPTLQDSLWKRFRPRPLLKPKALVGVASDLWGHSWRKKEFSGTQMSISLRVSAALRIVQGGHGYQPVEHKAVREQNGWKTLPLPWRLPSSCARIRVKRFSILVGLGHGVRGWQ